MTRRGWGLAILLAALLGPAGSAGAVVVPVSQSLDSAADVALTSTGKIVLAGFAINVDTGDDEIAVVQLLATGAPDPSFGGGDGIVTTPIGDGDSSAFGVIVEPDDEIVVAGRTTTDQPDFDTAIVRYTPTGALDDDFAGDGILTLGLGGIGLDDAGVDLVREPDGQIDVAAGIGEGSSRDYAVVRMSEAGILDTAFDGPTGTGNGLVVVNVQLFDSTRALLLQSDGKIVVAGGSGSPVASYAFVRLNAADGSFDSSFDGDLGGGNGIVQVSFGPTTGENVSALAASGTTGIVAAGSVDQGIEEEELGVARLLTADGTLDDTFGGDGLESVALTAGAAPDNTADVAVQADGKPLVVGDRFDVGGNDPIAARWTDTGVLDTAFDGPLGGGNGAFAFDFGGDGASRASGVVLDAAGNALVVGALSSPSTSSDFAITRLNAADGTIDPLFGIPDTDPPETTILAGPTPVDGNDGLFFFEFTADEPASFECSLDNAAFAPCGNGDEVGPFAPGAHIFAVRARDLADNVDPTPAARCFTIGGVGTCASGGGPDPGPGPGGGGVVDSTAPAIALLTRGPLRLDRRGRVKLKVNCPAAEPEPCAGTLTLRTAKKVEAAAKRIRKLGSKSFSIAPGRTGTVRIKLSRLGRRLVARRGRLRARTTVEATDTAGNKATVSRVLTVKKRR